MSAYYDYYILIYLKPLHKVYTYGNKKFLVCTGYIGMYVTSFRFSQINASSTHNLNNISCSRYLFGNIPYGGMVDIIPRRSIIPSEKITGGVTDEIEEYQRNVSNTRGLRLVAESLGEFQWTEKA